MSSVAKREKAVKKAVKKYLCAWEDVDSAREETREVAVRAALDEAAAAWEELEKAREKLRRELLEAAFRNELAREE